MDGAAGNDESFTWIGRARALVPSLATSFEPGLFFSPVLQKKSCETLSAGPRNLLQGLLVLRSGMECGRKGRHCPPPFPTAVPPRLALPG